MWLSWEVEERAKTGIVVEKWRPGGGRWREEGWRRGRRKGSGGIVRVCWGGGFLKWCFFG